MDRQRLEARLFDYISQCKTFDPKTRSIETADIPRLCKVFNLDYRECKKVFTPDSRGHVALPDLVHLAIRDNHPKTSSPYWGPNPTQRTMAYHHSSSSRGNIPHSLLHAPAIAFDTEGSFSPPPPDRYTPEEGPYLTRPSSRSAQESSRIQIPMVASPPDTTDMDTGRRSMSKGADYESHSHWGMVDGPDSSVVMNANAPPIGPSSHGQWTDQPTEDTDLEAKYRYRGQPVAPILSCQGCKHWIKVSQEMEDRYLHMRRERDRLDVQLDRVQKELQQATDYYAAYQMAVKDRDRYKSELRRFKDGVDSDGSRGMERHHYEEIKRNRDELDINLKQYRKHYNLLKDDHDQLKRKCQDLERRQWTLIDEKQRLSTELLRRDPLLSRHLGDGASDPSSQQSGRVSVKGSSSHRLTMMRTSSIGEHEFDIPVKDVPATSKARSMKSAPSEVSEGTQYTMGASVPTEGSQSFLVLGEDVSTSVLPDNFSQEQQLQIIYALKNCHSVQELIRCLVSYGLSSPDNQAQELQVENEHLKARLKHAESKNKTLTGSFENAKADSEAMYQKLSKVEANNCRMRHAMLLIRQAYNVQKVLYDMRVLDNHSGGAGSSFSPPVFGIYASSDRGEPTGVRNLLVNQARTLLHELESNQELQQYLPTTQTYESSNTKTGWMSITQDTGTTSGLSCVSSVGGEGELSSSESEQLAMHSQALMKYSSQLVESLSEVDGLKGLATLKEPCNAKDCSSSIGDPVGGKVMDIEESANTEEVCKVREEKAEMRSQIYMMEQSKRSMELQVSKIQLHSRMLEKSRAELQVVLQFEKKKRQRLKEKLKMLKVENPHLTDWTEQSAEIQASHDREREAVQRYEDLFRYLQSHVQDSQDVNSQLVDFVRELLRANRALVEAFEKARKRQQIEKKQMRLEMIQFYNRTHSSVHLPATDTPIP